MRAGWTGAQRPVHPTRTPGLSCSNRRSRFDRVGRATGSQEAETGWTGSDATGSLRSPVHPTRSLLSSPVHPTRSILSSPLAPPIVTPPRSSPHHVGSPFGRHSGQPLTPTAHSDLGRSRLVESSNHLRGSALYREASRCVRWTRRRLLCSVPRWGDEWVGERGAQRPAHPTETGSPTRAAENMWGA